MKKISVFPSLLISTVCVLGLMTCVVSAQTYTNGDWTYVSGNGSATITQYSGTASRVIIPATFGTLPVTRIGDYSLSGNTNVTQIIIPNGVLSFGHAAFLYCPQLTHVSIPNSVTDIGSAAFWDCTNLDSVYIPESVQSIGNSAFLNCTSLTHVYFGGNVPVQVSFSVFDRAPTTIYYTTNSSGWATSFAERPTQTYSLPSSDIDRDGVTHYRELIDGTDPNDPASFNPLSKGLVAYYPLDGNANDESGYGNNGSIEGTVTLAVDRFSSASNSYNFQGSGLISIPHNDSFSISDSNALTVSAWIYRTDDGTSGHILGKRPPGELTYNWQIHFESRVPWTFDFPEGTSFVSGTGVGTNVGCRSGTNPASREWVQVVGIYDHGNWSLYQDGVLVKTGTGSPHPDANTPLQIGSSGGFLPFIGHIDDVRIYNRALSTKEAQQLFYTESFTVAQRHFLALTPSVMGHYSLMDYNTNRTNGQTDVLANPSAFNLFTQNEYEGFGALQFSNGVSAGIGIILSNPSSYNLYTSDSIMDLRMGGLMIQRQGTNAVVSFQPQTTTDLTLPFTNNGIPVTNTIPMPGNKGFIRINAKP